MERLTKRERRIMDEAFMTGRVYANLKERETPADIQEKLERLCTNAANRKE